MAERAVGHKIGVLLQRLEILLEFLAQPLVGRLVFQRGDQRLRFALGLLQFTLYRGFFCFILGGCGLGLHRTRELGEIGGAVLHRIDEEAEGREAVGNALEVGIVGNVATVGEAPDVGFAGFERGNGSILAHDHQGTDDLVHRGVERRQIAALRSIPEETVQDLFDLCEVALNFLSHLSDEKLLLCLTRHFVKQWHLRSRFGRVAGKEAMQACDHDIDLMCEVVAKTGEVFLCVVGEKDCRCDFHRQRLAVARGLLGQPVGGIGDRLPEAAIVGLGQLIDQMVQGSGLIAEGVQCRRRTGAELVPCLLGTADRVPQAAAQLVQIGFRTGTGRLCGNHVAELVGSLHLTDKPGTAVGLGHIVESIAHQPFGDVLGALEQSADLQVDTGTELLDVDFCSKGAFCERRKHT